MTKSTDSDKTVATNRRARYDYDILDTWECGMVLTGSEVKSLRDSQVVIKDAYAEIRAGEVWLESMHIAPYVFARDGGHDPERRRKLLMHRREIDRLEGRINEEGLTLVPLKIYFRDGRAKIEIALVRGRRSYDKRQAIRAREQGREMDRALREERR
ncbi:MAG: SsrA-binding protein SmpB [Actinobacteria bacterium]|uniref:TmRNA-binding protein SmpB n=1 Tax=hydrothermal vent metagenome TaxID=652676 RepID=A0A3B0S9W8_9ZZZZ|nr:SsrA-binding protein SmpB [Actinomycetota bacterium]